MCTGELCNVRLDRMEHDYEEICHTKEVECYDTSVSQSTLFKIFNLREANDFYRKKKCFHMQLNLRNGNVK